MALVKNVGSADKMIRIVLGVVLLAFSFIKLGGFSSTVGIITAIVGVVLIATALINFCPLYRVLNMRTTKQSVE